MKKIYLSVAVMAVSASSFGQALLQQTMKQTITSQVAKEVVLPIHNAAASTPDDTLGFDELGSQLISYGSNSGYVFGTSSFEFPAPVPAGTFQFSLEFARGFIVNDPQNVIGAGFIFGSKEDASGAPAAAKAKLYSVQPMRALETLESTALDVDGPGSSLLASADLAFADADTSFPAITWVDFDNQGWVPSDFAIGLDITALYGAPSDTLVLLADEDGSSDGSSTWTRITQGASPAGQSFWVRSGGLLIDPLENNLAIFAVVAESGVGIEEQGYLNGVKATMFPNPSTSSDNVTIQYGLETAAQKVELSIVNVNGQVVYTAAEGAKASGIYNLNVPAGTLASGSYIYVLNADGSRIAKKMEVLK